jgi:hypothetical protein
MSGCAEFLAGRKQRAVDCGATARSPTLARVIGSDSQGPCAKPVSPSAVLDLLGGHWRNYNTA